MVIHKAPKKPKTRSEINELKKTHKAQIKKIGSEVKKMQERFEKIILLIKENHQ